MPTGYVTAFEVSRRIPDWQFVCIGPLLLLAGAALILLKRHFRWPEPKRPFLILLVSFGLLFTLAVSGGIAWQDLDAFNTYRAGNYKTVEGIVMDFQPMPYEGHQDECFTVQIRRFCYSDYGITPGFHKSASHGGPIHEGLPVRIAYKDNLILRLEVPSAQLPTKAQSAAVIAQAEQQSQRSMESDLTLQKIMGAFLIAATLWTLWWNIEWRRVMRFWLKPPYRPLTKMGFRIFFAANFIGALVQLIMQFKRHPLPRNEIFPMIQLGGLLSGIVYALSVGGLFLAERRDRKQRDGEASLR